MVATASPAVGSGRANAAYSPAGVRPAWQYAVVLVASGPIGDGFSYFGSSGTAFLRLTARRPGRVRARRWGDYSRCAAAAKRGQVDLQDEVGVACYEDEEVHQPLERDPGDAETDPDVDALLGHVGNEVSRGYRPLGASEALERGSAELPS